MTGSLKKIVLCLLLAACSLPVNGQTKRPLIGVSCNWSQGTVSVSGSYIQAVEQAGGLPVLIPFSADSSVLQAQIDRLDGLVLIGGEDFDPLLFGEEPHPNLGHVNKERDDYDLMLIRCALRRGIPLLGICRGLQGMNVFGGGTLYQDIPALYPAPSIRHRQNADRQYGSHTVILEDDCRLRPILGSDSLVVNSFHHQSIKDLAPGYRVVARSRDGVIEAIEKEGSGWVIGVQWHPEALDQGGDEPSRHLFRELVRQAGLPR